jgi:type IV pilus assembly protein PilX
MINPDLLPHVAPQRNQQGLTLLVSLIFLLVLSLLGIWAVTNNSLQERMAGNSRNRDLAFAAAEAALLHAESTLNTWRNGSFDGTDGLLPYVATNANDITYWRDINRWSSYRQVPSGTLNQVAELPRYVVQHMPTPAGGGSTEYYRVTARGVGGDINAVVILQSIVTYTPAP